MVLRLIEVAHHRRDIGLEETVAEYQHCQTAKHQPHGEGIVHRLVYGTAFGKNALLHEACRGEHQELAYRHCYAAEDD